MESVKEFLCVCRVAVYCATSAYLIIPRIQFSSFLSSSSSSPFSSNIFWYLSSRTHKKLVKRNPPSGFTASHVHAIPISSYYIYFIIILRSCGHFNVRRRQIIIADCAVGNINSTKKNFSSISLGARKK